MATGELQPGLGRLARGASSCRTLTTDYPTLFFTETAPNTGVLIGVECETQTVRLTRTRGAHLLRGLDLVDRKPGCTHWKEK